MAAAMAYRFVTGICHVLLPCLFSSQIYQDKEVEMENIAVYITAMQDSLQKKLDLLNRLLELTQEQGDIFRQEEPDLDNLDSLDSFDSIMQKKDELLQEMLELDKGFDALFVKIGTELKANKYQYQEQIKQMQNLIRSITDCGVRLEGMEKKNRDAFQEYLSGARKEIRDFKSNNKMATSYSQNMANQHRQWQSYFMDQKK